MVAVTLREVADLYGRNLQVIRSWRTRWNDWPPPLIPDRLEAPAPSGRHRGRVYDLHQISDCLARHGQLASTAGLWSIADVATHLGLGTRLVKARRYRGTLPDPAGFYGHRPWWRPATIQDWARTQLIPAGAWTATQVAAHTGLTIEACVRRGLSPDGTAGITRWWRPTTVEAWWRETTAAEQRLRDRPSAPAAPPPDPDPRWSMRDIAAHTGLSYDSVRRYRWAGKLPTADGTTTGGHPWWWPPTITSWDHPHHTGRPRRAPTAAPTTAPVGTVVRTDSKTATSSSAD